MVEVCSSIVVVNALLAAGLAIVVALLCSRIKRPAIRHLLWVLVLLRLLAPPVCVIDLSQQQTWLWNTVARHAAVHQAELRFGWRVHMSAIKRAVADRSAVVPVRTLYSRVMDEESSFDTQTAAMSGQTLADPKFDISAYVHRVWKCFVVLLMAVWVLGSIGCFAQQLLFVIRFKQRMYGNSYRSRIWQRRANKLAQKMGLAASPAILLVREPISPMLWGLSRRVQILIPDRLFEQLDRRGQNALLCHELAHYRRGDHWVRLLESLAMILYWWHPVLWWIRHEIEKTEEQCCDAIAVEQSYGHRRVYAEALLAAVDFVSAKSLPPAASGAIRNGVLRLRIEQIMLGRPGVATQPKLGPVMLFVCAAILLPFPTIWGEANSLPTVANSVTGSVGATNMPARAADFTASRDALLPTQAECRLETDEYHRTQLHARDGSTIEIGVGRLASSAWSGSKDQIAIGTTDGAVEIRSCSSGKLRFKLSCGHAAISNVTYSSDDQYLGVASLSGELTLVSTNDGEKIWSVSHQNARVVKLSFDQPDEIRVIWSQQNSVYEETWCLIDDRWVEGSR